MKPGSSLIALIFFFIPCLVHTQPPYDPAPSPLPNITAIEWFIDKDPGFGKGVPLSLTTFPDLVNLTPHLDLTGISKGVHRLFVRSKDQQGNWSLTMAGTFENLHPAYDAMPNAAAPISQLEVFFDHDPGFGKGKLIPVTTATDVANLPLTLGIDTLLKGPHQLFVRVAGNPPSLSSIAGFSNDVPLPLTWLYFTGKIVDGASRLDWATAQENNTKNFEVEHSLDAQTYTNIGIVPAAGNSSTTHSYTWTDPFPVKGINYYRIKQVDLDNKYTSSQIVALLFSPGQINTTVVPNPVRASLTLLLSHPADGPALTIYNTAGQPVLTIPLQPGSRQQTLDLQGLPAGAYFIRITNKTGTETLRILKQ